MLRELQGTVFIFLIFLFILCECVPVRAEKTEALPTPWSGCADKRLFISFIFVFFCNVRDDESHPDTMVLTALTQFSCKVNVDDTVEMLPKSRRALTIQEIAALARSSLHGISQVVKDHVTKPTAMAQGRVAHLIEWKGWCKPIDTPAALESDFNSYSDLTEGEQEARFAAGVAEQFAIAEAKLRAWSSVDGDESNDDSYDEDFLPANEPTTQSTDVPSYPPYLKDLIHSQLCQHLGLRGFCCEGGGGGGGGGEGGGSGEPSPTAGSPDTLCSSLCSLDEHHPLLRDLGGNRGNHGNAAELVAKILSALQGGEELLLARLQRAGQGGQGGADCGFHSLGGAGGRGIRPCGGQDSPCYSMSYSETYLSPGEDDDTPCKDYENTLCQVEAEGGGAEYPPDYDPRRRVSDVASSGVVSLDEEEEEEERGAEPNKQ
ncbi:protein FAM131A-like [Antennarius striatus]|uniref:protein FAM131A-like n=1 Tax=Antennarius striatus TaxID=241820 RepID=UPI0035AF2A69